MNITAFLISPSRRWSCRRSWPGSSTAPRRCSPGARVSRSCRATMIFFRLFRKGTVTSRTTSWVFRIAPVRHLRRHPGSDLLRALSAGRSSRPALPATCGAALSPGPGAIFPDPVGSRHRVGLRRHGSEPRGLLLGARRTRPVCLPAQRHAGERHRQHHAALSAPMVADSITVLLSALPLFIVLLPRMPASPSMIPTPTWNSP